ncbi:hypothetical protein CK203_074032 [Vitis vinifera]|uniref:Uncharacterized protein n=1 Tax=Vitis vinifera TaxID=29760 RepID=A0A438E7Z0_VITVI|nr:hypothetical protein CK203_074032 [Vitis vinifera]
MLEILHSSWSKFVKLFIHEKGKLGYLTGATKTPKEDNLGFQTWDSENSMILLWFVNSVEQEISQTRMFLTTTKELWELVMVTYSDLENSAQIFELKSKIHDIKQGDQVVIKEEIRRSVMMGGSSSTTIIENSALASTATKAANVAACQGNSKKTGSKGKILCDHYFMRAADQSMHAAAKSPTTITETSPFSKEQLEHLYRLFDQSPSSNSLPSCSLAQTGPMLREDDW